MTFTVSVSGGHRRLRGRWAEVASAWAREVEPVAVTVLRRAAPVGHGEGAGHLRDSIRAERTVSAAEVVIRFTSTAPYAGFVLDGTQAHEIRPRTKRALFWEGAAHPVRGVHHPGTRPNRFPERALAPLAPAIRGRLQALILEQLTT